MTLSVNMAPNHVPTSSLPWRPNAAGHTSGFGCGTTYEDASTAARCLRMPKLRQRGSLSNWMITRAASHVRASFGTSEITAAYNDAVFTNADFTRFFESIPRHCFTSPPRTPPMSSESHPVCANRDSAKIRRNQRLPVLVCQPFEPFWFKTS